jgi:hypothetical protein
VRFVTFTLQAALIAVAAAFLASSALASPSPHYPQRDVAFVTMNGHGTVTSTPRGINCPRNCRGICGFDLVSPHDCSGGACPLGAYGVRVLFVRR